MNKIKIFFLKVQAYLAFRARVIEARSLFAADGHRRFIIPFTDGTMEVLTQDEAIHLKDVGRLASDLSAKTIYGACFFFTATTNKHSRVQCEMPKIEVRRRKAYYYKWFIKHHS